MAAADAAAAGTRTSGAPARGQTTNQTKNLKRNRITLIFVDFIFNLTYRRRRNVHGKGSCDCFVNKSQQIQKCGGNFFLGEIFILRPKYDAKMDF